MKTFKQGCLMLTLGLLVQTASADSEFQIQLDTIKAGDTKEKVSAIFGRPASHEMYQWLGMTCEQLTFKKTLEEVTITLCINRVVATKYAARSLLGL
ncbi:MAG: hypothetical protein KGZ69_16170 [Methylomonas sp.]|nr:hypothetical protein [Methylomonas sp.]